MVGGCLGSRVSSGVTSPHPLSPLQSRHWLSQRDPRDAVAQRMLNIPCFTMSHHMIIKQFLVLRLALYGNKTIPPTGPVAAEYRSRLRVGVINSCRRRSKSLKFTDELYRQRLRRSAVPEIWLVPNKI